MISETISQPRNLVAVSFSREKLLPTVIFNVPYYNAGTLLNATVQEITHCLDRSC
jgi:hypothetical protein